MPEKVPNWDDYTALAQRVTVLEQNGSTPPDPPNPGDNRDPTDTSKWSLVFEDDFTNTDIDWTTWNDAYYGDVRQLSSNGEHQIYVSPSYKGSSQKPLNINPFVLKNSILTIQANPTPKDALQYLWNVPYVSGMLRSNFTFTDGIRAVARMRLPIGKGLWSAFWGVAKDMWPPEWDGLEAFGADNGRGEGGPFMAHWGGFGGPGQTDDNWGAWFHSDTDLTKDFHCYIMEYDNGEVRHFLDDKLMGPHKLPANWKGKALNLQVDLAVGGNWPGYPDANNKWPGSLDVDFVRAYKGK